MDRFEWTSQHYSPSESSICKQASVRLYDGENKTSYDHGMLELTSHRIVWKDHDDPQCCICLQLALIIFTENVPSTLTKSSKIILHLNAVPSTKKPGPLQHSPFCHIKLSFKKGGCEQFSSQLIKALSDQKWKNSLSTTPFASDKKTRTGISGIERQIHAKNRQTDENISKAFEDLKQLMNMAKAMVCLSKSISTKIKEKQGDISEDETVKFKSYLLSLGIDDPVTRDTHGSGDAFHTQLAKQMSQFIQPHVQDGGGTMALTDVYCRMNRARGLELLSPDDLLNACKLLNNLNLPLCFKTFDSGVAVLQLRSHDEHHVRLETAVKVKEVGCIGASDLSTMIGISVVLAKERLLAAEKIGLLCRDDSIEGLKFYENLFVKDQN